ncbi:MAG: hypothetical protein KA024_02525, partial [Zoogloea sp.]|nr:hypothetical protein [Zoogloea sp.]
QKRVLVARKGLDVRAEFQLKSRYGDTAVLGEAIENLGSVEGVEINKAADHECAAPSERLRGAAMHRDGASGVLMEVRPRVALRRMVGEDIVVAA